jgi:hypothetical protein
MPSVTSSVARSQPAPAATLPPRAARYPTDEPARGERRSARKGEDGSDRGDPPPTAEQNHEAVI